jgi:hypothetical protein
MQHLKKGLGTKGAVKKRFRITAKGNLKYFPSSAGKGRARYVYRRGVKGNAIHMLKLFPGSRFHNTTNHTMKKRYLETDEEIEAISKLSPLS